MQKQMRPFPTFNVSVAFFQKLGFFRDFAGTVAGDLPEPDWQRM